MKQGSSRGGNEDDTFNTTFPTKLTVSHSRLDLLPAALRAAGRGPTLAALTVKGRACCGKSSGHTSAFPPQPHHEPHVLLRLPVF